VIKKGDAPRLSHRTANEADADDCHINAQPGAAPDRFSASRTIPVESATLQLARLCMNHALQRTTLAIVQHRWRHATRWRDQREAARARTFLRRQIDQGLRHRGRTARPQAEDKGGGQNGNEAGRRQQQRSDFHE